MLETIINTTNLKVTSDIKQLLREMSITDADIQKALRIISVLNQIDATS